jgi:DNA repair exonuclease SbcCD ATPase subunit
LRILEDGINNINKFQSSNDSEIRSNESVLYDLSTKKARIEANKNVFVSNNNFASTNSTCPVCKQALPIKTQKELVGDLSTKIIDCKEQIAELDDEIATQKEVVEHLRLSKLELQKHKDKLVRWFHRLGGRLAQKEYVWTTKDVEVMKQCVTELDGFTTFYITEKLKKLEPLVNTVLSKLGFSVMFDVNDKNNFDITLIRNGAEFKYKDLSNGQRLLVTVAFQLALLMEKNESGLVVADEGFSSLDSKNLDLMFDLFKNSNFQLISIVHRFDTKDPAVNNILL